MDQREAQNIVFISSDTQKPWGRLYKHSNGTEKPKKYSHVHYFRRKLTAPEFTDLHAQFISVSFLIAITLVSQILLLIRKFQT